ncbi:MAG: type II secretion system protein M [Lachnospiraceae bacterium]|nr:type II secretion system protein M [Lachnospiraceae bacterium]
MATGITARDKKLLYMLGIIVIVSLFYIIGIRPLNRRITKLEDKIDDAQVEHDTIKMKLYQLDMITDFKESAEAMADKLSSRYYDSMVPADVDKLITNKALGYGLKINNLGIQTGKEPANVLAYVNSEAFAAQQRAIEAAESSADSVADSEASEDAASSVSDDMVDIDVLASINQESGIYEVADTTSAEVYITSMVLDVYGPHDKAQSLLDDIINDKALRVTSYQWTDMTTLPYQYVNGELVQVEQESGNRLVINFDLYMYDGSDFKAMAKQDQEGK